MTRPKCKGCETLFLRYAIFSYTEGCGPYQLYAEIDNNYCNYCISCFICNNYHNEINGFIGILKRNDFLNYKNRCGAGTPFEKLWSEGIVKLNLEDYKTLKHSLGYLRSAYLSKMGQKQMKLEELPDNFEYKNKYHPYRVWKQLYPEDTTNNGVSKKKDDDSTLVCLRRSVEEIISPHEYFGKLAKDTFEEFSKKQLNNNQIQEGMGNLERQMSEQDINLLKSNLKRGILDHNILRLKNVNMLARGPGLDADQQPHVDSLNYDLILIMPILSDNNGYRIKCFRRSHLINHQKLEEMIGGGNGAVEFPLSSLTEEKVSTNEVIILFENTIHCGGTSSAENGNIEYVTREQLQKVDWFNTNKQLLPTDVSIQFTFENSFIESSNDTVKGRAAPRWIYNAGQCIESKQKWNDSIEEDEYQTKQSEGTARYFNQLMFGLRSLTRKRKASNYI